MRKAQPAAALELLTDANRIAETLGYSHLLSASLRQLALLELDGSNAAPRALAVQEAVKKLQRCHKISTSNGLIRAACDDALNMHAARLEHRIGARSEALAGLEAALKEAKSIQYKAAQVDLHIALAAGYMCHPEGGAGRTADPAYLVKADEHLEAALKLAEPESTAHAHILAQQSLIHVLRANLGGTHPPSSPADTEEVAPALQALRCATESLCMRTGTANLAAALEAAVDPAALTNLGVAMLTAQRTTWEQPEPDATAAAATAKSIFDRALGAAAKENIAEVRGRALLAMACAEEALGEAEAAMDHLHTLLELIAAASELSEDVQSLATRGHSCRAAKDVDGALAAYREALAAYAEPRRPTAASKA